MSEKHSCEDCVHFRRAPYQAKHEGCYLPANMVGKQKDAYLDEQQIPGDHEEINRDGDCPDHRARVERPSFFQRLFSLGA